VKPANDEAVWGLPDYLPEDERMVWQGRPDWRRLAVEVFHVRKVAFYFAILGLARGAFLYAEGADPVAVLQGISLLWLLGLATAAILLGMAYLYGRSTIYTMTSKRLVLRFGVALPMMINIPWSKIDAADLVKRSGVTGDLSLTLNPGKRMSYWLLWPHAKPWTFSPVRPTLRCLRDYETAVAHLQAIVGSQTDASVAAMDRRTGRKAGPALAGNGRRTAAFT
jgi:hypothetical protein